MREVLLITPHQRQKPNAIYLGRVKMLFINALKPQHTQNWLMIWSLLWRVTSSRHLCHWSCTQECPSLYSIVLPDWNEGRRELGICERIKWLRSSGLDFLINLSLVTVYTPQWYRVHKLKQSYSRMALSFSTVQMLVCVQASTTCLWDSPSLVKSTDRTGRAAVHR